MHEFEAIENYCPAADSEKRKERLWNIGKAGTQLIVGMRFVSGSPGSGAGVIRRTQVVARAKASLRFTYYHLDRYASTQ